MDGQALDGHIITTLNVPDEFICRMQCYLNDACVSCNFGMNDSVTENICELNNSTDKTHLKMKENFVYRGSEVRKLSKILESLCGYMFYRVCDIVSTCPHSFTIVWNFACSLKLFHSVGEL